MSWILDGYCVKVQYCDVVATGVVESSRVKYGGSVQYIVILDESITLPWRDEPVSRVLVDQKDILEV